jgi:MFS transporter, SP family, arabinose:H+ symporter
MQLPYGSYRAGAHWSGRPQLRYTTTIALIAALGGFLMGFDASVISGVVGFIEVEFALSKLELGWSVSSLVLTATLAMLLAGPLSDRIGRRPVLRIAALLFAVSAIICAIAPTFSMLVFGRMLGGLGVGAALIVAPMYIAEIAPARARGRMVSFNQLNIVLGISTAFFSNYLVLRLGQSGAGWAAALNFGEWAWRWMFAMELLPAVIYFFALLAVPESPRWLVMHGRDPEALAVLARANGEDEAAKVHHNILDSVQSEAGREPAAWRELLAPSMRFVLLIGVCIGILQQITGINAVFFYAPMIFEQSGIGTNAAFVQAAMLGVVNVVFTVVALLLIDRLGRRPLLGVGLAGIAICMFTLSWGFGSATYVLNNEAVADLSQDIDRGRLAPLLGRSFDSDIEFREAVSAAIGPDSFKQHQGDLIVAAINVNPHVILFATLGFVASFAVSLGPIMWVLFSELFPNRVRGMAISFVGLVNSATAFLVTFIFPWELETIGNAATFLIYGLFAVAGFAYVVRSLPETKGRTLEELEVLLVRA